MNKEDLADLIDECLELMDKGYTCGEAASEICYRHKLTDKQTDDVMFKVERAWWDDKADQIREDMCTFKHMGIDHE